MPKEKWTKTSDTLIIHGRRICKPRPLCEQCAVREDCLYYQKVIRTVRPEAQSQKPEAKPRERTMTRERFNQLVEDALKEIPRRFRKEMRNVAVVVEDEPSPELLDEMEIEPGDTLFGLYQGTPLPERSWSFGNNLPDRISIYQKPTEEACETEDDIRDCIAETVIHEFGHYFGMSEEEIEEIEEKFWRGESIEDE